MKKIYTSTILLALVLLLSISSFGQIIAVNDTMAAVNGAIGNPNVGNVLNDNGNGVDTLNGNPVTISQVNITVVTPATAVTVGALVPTLNPSTANVSVPGNTPAGTYTITYSICEIANPTNCSTAIVTFTVNASPIDAVNDNISSVNGVVGNPNAGNVLSNDSLNGTPAIINQINLNSILGATPQNGGAPVPILNITTGTISVPANTPAGTYTIIYQICEKLNPTNCATAQVTITVNSTFNINVVGTYNDYNNDGFTNVGDVINYQITLTNSGPTAITNLMNCQSAITISGGTLSSLNAGSSNSNFFTGVHVITQSEINVGYVNGGVCFCGDSGIQACANGINTTLNQSNGIKLQAFIDSNSNGVKDASESFFSGGNFNYTINGGATTNLYSSNGITYLYESNPTTTYNLSYTIPSYYLPYSSCPTQYNNITVPNGSGITTYNFPIIVTPYTDLAVYLLPTMNPRPGFNYIQYILIKNSGNQTIASGTVTFTKDNALTITTLPSGATATVNGFTYNFTNLLPYESRYVYVLFSVPTIPSVAIGQLVTNTASITIPSGDAHVNNNTSTIIQDIRASYDPNDKLENHGGKILHSSFTANDYLTYTIQFENTGNANAINVKVDDVLDSKLDENSIVMLASSDDYILNRVGNNLSWKFNGINLPPSVANTQTGHGYITFQIKPKPGYAIGDIIPNVANIFFDSNPAIVTNVCNTQFVSTLANDAFAFPGFKLFPNPVKNSLAISNNNTIDEVEITSILGQKMMVKTVNDLQAEIDLSELSNGVYFVKVKSEGQEKTAKIVKE